MKQVLIIENSTNKLQPIMESAGKVNGTKDYVLGGIFTEFDVKNRNERIYTANKFLPHLVELNERITSNPGVVYGEFDHPDSFDISLSRISHVITEAKFIEEENLVRGEIKLLGTKYGKEAKAIVDDGFPIFVSSRAAGVTESDGVVNLKKLFTYDAVADPGFGSAKMEMKGNLNESLGYNNNSNFRIFDLSKDTKTNELFEMNSNDMVTKDQLVEYSKYLTGELEKMQAKLEGFATGTEGTPDFAKMQKMITEYDSMQLVQEKLVGYVNYLSDHLKHVLIENKSLKSGQEKIVEHTNYLADEIGVNSEKSEMLAEHIYDNKELLTGVNEEVKDLAEYSNYLSEHLVKTIEYAEYITENLVNTIEFTDYLSENLDASIAFSDYLAENVDAGIDMSNYLAEHMETTIEYAEYITENVSDNIEYIDYIAENLDKNIGHAEYITEKLNKKFGTAKMINENVNEEEVESTEAAVEATEEVETTTESTEEVNTVATEEVSEEAEVNAETTEEVSEEAEINTEEEVVESTEEEVSEEATEESTEEEEVEATNEEGELEIEAEPVFGEEEVEGEGEEGAADFTAEMPAEAPEDDGYFMSPDEFSNTMDAEAEAGEEEVIACTRDEEGDLVPADVEGEAEVEPMYDEEGNLIPAEADIEGEETEAGIEETPIGDDTIAAEEEPDEDMMNTDPMLTGIAAGKVVKIGGTVETARVVSVSDEGVVVEMTSTGEQTLKQANEIVPLNDDGTESSLTDEVNNLIDEAKKREASKDEDPHFFTFLSESQKSNFKELSQDDQEKIKVTINESDGYFCQADVLKIMYRALEVEADTIEEKLVKNMPEDVGPIWEQLDAKSKNGIFAQARIHNLNTPDLMEHFWRTRPQLKDNTSMLTEGKKTVDTDIIDNSELGEDVINMFKDKFNNLK